MAGDVDWDDARDDVIDDTLETLRDQRDEAQENHLYGTIDFNPQAFINGSHLVIGPITFETAFSTIPSISLDQQQGGINQLDIPAGPAATNYRPFLVEPYIYSWVMDRGTFAGFYIGLYRDNDSYPVTATKHTIHWTVSGKASAYKDERSEESWTETYDHNEPEYLVEDASDGYYEDDTDEG